jgi:competence protein ComEA
MKYLFLIAVAFAISLFAKVDINTAGVKELQALKGVGEKKAGAIVEYRTKNGQFKSIEDLTKVNGIGKKIIDDNKNELEIKSTQKK